MKKVDIKKIIMQHNRVASAVMNTKYDTRENTLATYKNFIDSNETIAEILSPVKIASVDAPDLFKNEKGGISIYSDSDEIKDKAILYKHLTFMVENDKELKYYAHSIYWTERKFDVAIQKLLQASVRPLIEYVTLKLEEMYVDAEDQENTEKKISIHTGDNIYGNNVQKVEKGQASMKNVGNDNSKKKFNFQKESFFLGVLSAVVSGLIVFGLEELIRYLINVL